MLGYAEKAQEISKTWSSAMAYGDYPPDLTREALQAKAPFKEGLEKRAKAALRILVMVALKRALSKSVMRADVVAFDSLPAEFDYSSLQEVLQQIKDRAIAWKVSNAMLEGKAKTGGELEMVFVERVWQVTVLAEVLAHDMSHENYIGSGALLAQALAAVIADTAEWLEVFDELKAAV